PPDGDGQRLGLQPGPVAVRAVDLAHVLLDLLTRVIRLSIGMSAVQPGHDPFELGGVGAPAAEAVPVLDVDRLALRPVQDQLAVLGPESLPGRVYRESA